MRETEKFFKELNKFLDEHGGEENLTKAELERLVGQFEESYNAGLAAKGAAPKTADDYLDLALSADSDSETLKYLDKALALEPDNLDAGLSRAILTAKTNTALLDALSELIRQGEAQLAAEDYFDPENLGRFWEILETRPYMRVRKAYLDTLIECGMLRRAISEGEKMLDLCENDNLGIRYSLMHLYACMEDLDSAEKLHARYEGNYEAMIMLPLAVLAYKLGKFELAHQYLSDLYAVNKNVKKFLRAVSRDRLYEQYGDEVSEYGYRPCSMGELITVMEEHEFLYDTVPFFFEWADRALKKTK